MSIIDGLQAYELAQKGAFNKLRESRISTWFTWKEVFRNATDQEIKAAPHWIFSNAEKQALTMELVRMHFGRPVIVSSWYRSRQRNAKIPGSAPNSMHLFGLATDFVIAGLSADSIQRALDPLPWMKERGMEWTGGNWSHVDSRPLDVGKKTGYRFGPPRR